MPQTGDPCETIADCPAGWACDAGWCADPNAPGAARLDGVPAPDDMPRADYLSPATVAAVQAEVTTTQVRCWYRTADGHDDPQTTWAWAANELGGVYALSGFWCSATPQLGHFVTDESAQALHDRCVATLDDIVTYEQDAATVEANTANAIARLVGSRGSTWCCSTPAPSSPRSSRTRRPTASW